jgi:Transposase DDE domain
MHSRCGKSDGIACEDSTALCVCKNIRIPRHKTFADHAGRSKSSIGWFYSFKLHFTVNDCGDILSFCLKRGNVDDRTPVHYLVKDLIVTVVIFPKTDRTVSDAGCRTNQHVKKEHETQSHCRVR